MPPRSLRKSVVKPKAEQKEVQKGREARIKYADMARASGHMSKREADDFWQRAQSQRVGGGFQSR